MIHLKKVTITIILLFFVLISHFSSVVRAQQVSIGVSPPLLELYIKPGKSVLIAYKIENNGDPVVLKSFVLPFEPKDSLGNIRIIPEFQGPVRFNLDNSIIQLNQPYVMKSNDSQQLLLRIRVPEGAPEGDYYYTLLTETQPPPVVEGVAMGRAKASIGSNILVTVTQNGNLDLNGKISTLEIIPRLKIPWGKRSINIIDATDKVPLVLVVHNKGKNFMKPEGKITLKSNFGEKATYNIIPQNILAQSERTLTASPSASYDCTLPAEQSLCKNTPSLVLSGFFVGRYQISADIGFGESSPRTFASTEFIALPLKFIVALIAVTIISALLMITIKRRQNQEIDIYK